MLMLRKTEYFPGYYLYYTKYVEVYLTLLVSIRFCFFHKIVYCQADLSSVYDYVASWHKVISDLTCKIWEENRHQYVFQFTKTPKEER